MAVENWPVGWFFCKLLSSVMYSFKAENLLSAVHPGNALLSVMVMHSVMVSCGVLAISVLLWLSGLLTI
jgi:hypothetical protein